MYVIGTAGHVDHGKSTLVEALTHIDPDRLKEEKQRKLTIDLGFAWFSLANEMVGIVDVPGHRDFIENMLAGVGGMDAVMLVIAADEGVMPQTREHLAILNLLGIEHGLVALTKIDLIDDDEWLELLQADIADTLATTALAQAPIIPVSAKTGVGLDTLRDILQRILTAIPSQPETDTPYLPVDRVFSISGFGTVVTGTLTGGLLHVGDEIEVQPGDHRGRVRNLQSYEQSVEVAYPGTRTAINIAGIDKKHIQRGSIVSPPNKLKPTLIIDAHYHHLDDAPHPLKHNTQVKLFSGAAQMLGRVRLLDAEMIQAGEKGWLQIRLDKPVAIRPNSRFILRLPSPKATIGGGVVVNIAPQRRYKRFQPQIIRALQIQLNGTPQERIQHACDQPTPVTIAALAEKTSLAQAQCDEAMHILLEAGELILLDETHAITTKWLTHYQKAIYMLVENYHKTYPLRTGMPKEALRNQVQLSNKHLELILNTRNDTLIQTADSATIKLTQHQIVLSPTQEEAVAKLTQAFNQQPQTPPSYDQALDIIGDAELLGMCIQQGDFVQLTSDVLFDKLTYETMRKRVLHMLDDGDTVSVQTVRDALNTSRKFAVALLEHLDQIGITRRNGDERVRR